MATTNTARLPGVRYNVKETNYTRKWREVKPCDTCGHKRLVQIRVWKKGSAGSGTEAANEETPSWNRTCDACDLMQRAVNHEHQARVFRERARSILAKRQK